MTSPRPDATAGLIRELARCGLTVAVAESLTGGELLAELTRPAGASVVVVGGVVAYATELKHTLCGVDRELLATHGPVHPEVARQLAEGVRTSLTVEGRAASIGVATTGVAGPDPQAGRKAGTVFVGVADASGTQVVELDLAGDRASIRHQVVERALEMLVVRFPKPTTGGVGAE